MHEFHIFYAYSEWNLLSSVCVNGDKICEGNAVKPNKLISRRV